MDHTDHVNLLKPANLNPGGLWADFGAGSGAFTLALRELVGPLADIFALDKDSARLRELEQAYRAHFGETGQLRILPADIQRPLDLPLLDGAVMANCLHFFREQESLLLRLRAYLKPGAIFLLVEYNVDAGNLWVPHPLSFETYRQLAPRAGFREPRLLAKRPSHFLREIYSAIALNSGNM